MRFSRQRRLHPVPVAPPRPPVVTAIGAGGVWELRDGNGCACLVAEGQSGLVLVNTGPDAARGQVIAATLPLLSPKPVRAIVYPGAAMRHCLGTAAIVAPAEVATGAVVVAGPPAWGTEGLTETWPPPPVGPPGPGFPPVPPNLLVPGDRWLRLAGVRLRLLPVGGQALAVHLPEHRLAFLDEPGAGATGWTAAVDALLCSRIEHVLGAHLPLRSGSRQAAHLLTLWRDSVQHRHDQSVRRALAGAEDAAAQPLPELAEFPELRHWLGARGSCGVEQSTAAAITSARPAPRATRAQRVVQLAGGRAPVLAEARRRLATADPQGAAQLAADLVLLDPADAEARQVWGVALCDLAEAEADPAQQRRYRTAAATLAEDTDPAVARRALAERLRARPPCALLELLRYRLDPARAPGHGLRLRCRITDTGEQFDLELRNKVLLVRRPAPHHPAGATVVLGSAALAEYVAGAADLADLLVRHQVTVDGRPETAAAFFAAFDRDPNIPRRQGDQPCAPR